MADLRIENMSVSASGAMLVKPLSFCARPSEMIAIIGPNGAGKTSLLRSIIGLGEQVTGGAFIDGQAVSVMKPHHRAQLISYLPQSLPLAWPIRVTDAVALGRYPHGADSEGDAAVERALSDCDLLALAQRSTDSLSGGELTRVHVARTFACAAPIILVDEPIAALDPSHALSVQALVRLLGGFRFFSDLLLGHVHRAAMLRRKLLRRELSVLEIEAVVRRRVVVLVDVDAIHDVDQFA